MIEIRRAEARDIAWILSQLKEFSQFIETRHQLYGSEEYSCKGIQLLIEEHVFFIAEENNEPIGFVSGYFTPHLFNPDIRILCELFFWVVPSKRGCRAGSLLMDAYIDEGMKKAQWITFGLNRFTRVNERSLIKRGFAHHETTFLMEV